jgi:ParB/RepB/Spo0J family partition protein
MTYRMTTQKQTPPSRGNSSAALDPNRSRAAPSHSPLAGDGQNAPVRAIPSTPADGALVHIDVDLLDENPFQPRTSMDEAKLVELAASIAQSGLLQSIVVRPAGAGRYQIVAGHRRVAAFKNLKDGASTDEERRRFRLIPAQVKRDLDDSQMAVGAYVENAQRADLSPLEEAAALTKIRDLIGAGSAKDLACAVGQNEQRVRRLLRLAVAPEVVKDAVTNGLLVPVARGVGDFPPPRRERRRLDLHAALEFVRLYDHVFAKKPALAEERVRAAIHRALEDGWGLRRIQQYVEASIGGRISGGVAPTRVDGTVRPPPPPAPLIEHSSNRLIVHLGRLEDANAEALHALARTLRDLTVDVTARATAASAAIPHRNQH